MGSEHQPLRHIGIYRNLPTFDPAITGLSAIVTGANGISGFYLMRALLDSPDRWTKIYALSRRPPPEAMMAMLTPAQRARVQHIAVDFLKEPQEIAAALTAAHVQASHVFFYSYLQPTPPPGQSMWSNAQELVDVNTALLSNFLSALPLANITPARVVLQTGAKNYGRHIGRARQPAYESDPQPAHLEPNFYYPQEKLLFDFCTAQNTTWNVIRPAWIVGAVTAAAMNALHPYAVYAAVRARQHLPLEFPGTWDDWQAVSFHSTARLTGYLAEWAALEPGCADHAFNAQDGSTGFSMDRFYERLSSWYGAPVAPPETDPDKFTAKVGKSGKDTPMGYGPPAVYRSTFSFVEWAKEPANREVWRTLQTESGGKLTDDPFERPEETFCCADQAYLSLALSMDKARKMGWSGFVDTVESVREMYTDMVGLGMLPEMNGAGKKVNGH